MTAYHAEMQCFRLTMCLSAGFGCDVVLRVISKKHAIKAVISDQIFKRGEV